MTAIYVRRRGHQNELASYKAELRSKGELLTLGDLPPPVCTNGNPNLAKLTNAVAKLHSRKTDVDFAMMKSTRPGFARIAWLQDELVDHSGSTNDWEDLAQSLIENTAELRSIRQSLEKPEPDTGWCRTNIFDLPRALVARRSTARCLAAATLSALHEKQFLSALENLHLIFQLARVQKDDFDFINQMICVAVVNSAISVTWEALQHADWSDDQMMRLQNDLSSINLVEAFEKGLVGDRILGNEAFQSMNRLNQTNFFVDLPRPILVTGLNGIFKDDELYYLKATQQRIECFRLVLKGTPWPKVKQTLEEGAIHHRELSSSYRRYLHLLSMVMIPQTQLAAQKAVQVETQRQMALAAVALKRYQLRHSKLPFDLASLVPEFLSELPRDWIDQKPIKYRPTATSFVLYSVGEDGLDDGGNPNPPAPLGKKEYELWDGKDAVWPAAELKTP